jgi:putative ABC transport system permease protein
MSLFRLALAFIRRRPGVWLLQVVILAFGIGLVTTLLLLERGVERRFARDLGGVDLVVGAKGSPLQIVLSSLFAMDTPTGNIPLAQAEAIARNPLVATAVPVSIGDNVGGYRIVGTTRDYAALYGARLGRGEWWHAPLEAVAGATVARRLRLGLNSEFVSEHGLSGGEAHRATPYRIVGILRPSGSIVDRLVLTDTASVWRVHEGERAQAAAIPGLATTGDERQVTALLVRYRSAMGAVMLPQLVSARPDLQAASPAVEMRRLARAVGIGANVVQGLAIALLLLAAGGFVVNLWSTIDQRRPELALLRVLGASRARLVSLICLEATILGATGSALGVALARGMVAVLDQAALRYGAEFSVPPLSLTELSIVAGGTALAVLAGLPAALLAGYTEPARELVRA